MITREEASRNSMKISKFKLNYIRWVINKMIKKSSKLGNKGLDLSTKTLIGASYRPKHYIIGNISTRGMTVYLNCIADELRKEGFNVWCLPNEEYSNLWAERKIMKISWIDENEQEHDYFYYTKRLESLLEAMKERNISIINGASRSKIQSFWTYDGEIRVEMTKIEE